MSLVILTIKYYEWKERIYLCTIKGAERPYIVVDQLCESLFHNGEEFVVSEYIQMKPFKEPKVKEYTMEELQEKLGETIKIIK